MPRLLFITLSNIGDLVLTTPALEALHHGYPDHLIDVVADTRSSVLLRACPYLGTLYHRQKSDGIRGLLGLVTELRKRRYTAIVDLRTDYLPWLLRGDRRASRWRRPPHGIHAVEQHFAITSQVFPFAVALPVTRVWVSPEDIASAKTLLAKKTRGRWLALAPGANWAGKIWPVSHFAALVAAVTDIFDGVIILGSPPDAVAAEILIENCPLPCLNVVGKTSLTVAAAVCDEVDAFVGNDSGLGHIAAARGIPTLTLFGPGRPDRYVPWGPKASRVLAPAEDLKALQAPVVGAALRALLAR